MCLCPLFNIHNTHTHTRTQDKSCEIKRTLSLDVYNKFISQHFVAIYVVHNFSTFLAQQQTGRYHALCTFKIQPLWCVADNIELSKTILWVNSGRALRLVKNVFLYVKYSILNRMQARTYHDTSFFCSSHVPHSSIPTWICVMYQWKTYKNVCVCLSVCWNSCMYESKTGGKRYEYDFFIMV